MMKGGKDKAVKPGRFPDKAVPAEVPRAAEEIPAVWVCISGCNVPEVGTWKGGDRITDPAIIAKICGSPNFTKIEEVE